MVGSRRLSHGTIGKKLGLGMAAASIVLIPALSAWSAETTMGPNASVGPNASMGTPHEMGMNHDMGTGGMGMSGMMDDQAPTPAGMFGAKMAPEGKLMLGYTPMIMHMSGNYIGSSTVSSQTIASTIPSDTTIGATTVHEKYRIVPSSMDVTSHMFHMMYGVTDWANIAIMATYLSKSMTMTTFLGTSGTNVLGQSTSATEGFGDTSVASTIRLYQDGMHHLHLNAGLSLPTGSNTETVTMLSPMKTFMTSRASYGMQLGTGTVDVLPGLTYTGHLAQWNWGAAYRGRIAMNDNAEGYNYGPQHELDGWGGYAVIPGVTLTGRTVWSIQGRIHGADSRISGVMQGTNPAFYGGTRVDMLGGVALSGAPIGYNNVHLALEGGAPITQDLNGPQLGRNWQFNLAFSAGF